MAVRTSQPWDRLFELLTGGARSGGNPWRDESISSHRSRAAKTDRRHDPLGHRTDCMKALSRTSFRAVFDARTSPRSLRHTLKGAPGAVANQTGPQVGFPPSSSMSGRVNDRPPHPDRAQGTCLVLNETTRNSSSALARPAGPDGLRTGCVVENEIESTDRTNFRVALSTGLRLRQFFAREGGSDSLFGRPLAFEKNSFNKMVPIEHTGNTSLLPEGIRTRFPSLPLTPAVGSSEAAAARVMGSETATICLGSRPSTWLCAQKGTGTELMPPCVSAREPVQALCWFS